MMKLHEKEVFEWMTEKADVEGDEDDEDEDDDSDEEEAEAEDEEAAADGVTEPGDTESDNDTRNVLSDPAANTRGESDGDTIDDPAETASNIDSGSHQFLVPVVQGTNRASGEVASVSAGANTSSDAGVGAAVPAGVEKNASARSNGGDVYMTTE